MIDTLSLIQFQICLEYDLASLALRRSLEAGAFCRQPGLGARRAMLKFRPLRADEVPLLRDRAPPDWNVDLAQFFAFHFGQAYFYPVAAELDGKLVGCANGLLNGPVGWLGNIIVLPEFRGQGIGRALTEHLVAYFRGQGCRTQLLIASRMGEGLYKKLGFITSTSYIFLRYEASVRFRPSRRIRLLQAEDIPAILGLDRWVSGEERAPFLGRFMSSGYVYATSGGNIGGCLLPGMGNGLILAWEKQAGLALLKFKLAQGSPRVVVPADNTEALALLQQVGYTETGRMPRMALGPELDWRPELVFSRGSGSTG